MSDFINTGLLPPKPLVPEHRQLDPKITSDDWGLVLDALSDLRGAAISPTLPSDPTSPISTGTDVKLRNNGGILQVSSAGGAYQDVVTSGGSGALTGTTLSISGAASVGTLTAGNVTTTTTAATTLYVDAAGNDSNDGSIGSPLLTIQAAVNKVPKLVRHPVTINVSAGTFAGFGIHGFTFNPADTSVGAYIGVVGTLIDATLATGTATGTLTSSTTGSATTVTRTVVTDSGQTWTVNDLKGKLIEMTSGGNSGEVYPIIANTGTTVTVARSGALAVGTYRIRSWGTIVNTASALTGPGGISGAKASISHTVGAGGIIAITSNQAGRTLLGVTAATGSPAVVGIMGIQVTSASSSLVHTDNDSGIYMLSGCSLAPTGAVSIFVGNGNAPLVISSCVVGSNTNPIISGDRPSALQYCLLTGTTSSGFTSAGPSSALGMFDVESETTTFMSFSAGSINGFFSRVNVAFAGGIKWTGTTGISFGSTTSSLTGSIVSTSGLSLNASGTAVSLSGLVQLTSSGNMLGTSTTVFSLNRGARVHLSSGSTISGTNEIVLDGAAAATIASMRAASPKLLTNTYGTIIHE